MDQKTNTEELIQYLLGRLSETEQAQVEQEFFANNEYFEQLLAVEDALIDRYLMCQLSEEDRQAVESLLNSSARQQEEVELARDLMGAVSKAATSGKSTTLQDNLKPKPGWSMPAITRLQARGNRFSAIVVLVLFALSVSLIAWTMYLLPQKRQAERELAQEKEANQKMRQQLIESGELSEKLTKELEGEKAKHQQAEQLIAQLQTPSPDARANEIGPVVLFPDRMSRGSGHLKVVNIKAGADKVQFRLEVETNVTYSWYNVIIRSFEGNEIWKSKPLGDNQVRRGRLVLSVPANVFSANDYTVMLMGVSAEGSTIEIGDYSFRVTR